MKTHLIMRYGTVTSPRCRWWSREHEWELRQRRSVPVQLAEKNILAYVTRWECSRCGARGVLTTIDKDVLWQLNVEVPEAEETRTP